MLKLNEKYKEMSGISEDESQSLGFLKDLKKSNRFDNAHRWHCKPENDIMDEK